MEKAKSSCFIFHKWTKWSKPIEETWREYVSYRGIPIPESEKDVTKYKQERTCEHCGLYQRRYVT